MDVKHLTLPILNEKQISCFWLKTRLNPITNCLEWIGGSKSKKGYARFKVDKRRILVHRLAYSLHHKVNPKKLFVLHSCDNKVCLAKEHLFLGTHKDNMADMKKKGRAAKGDKNGTRLHPNCVLRGERIGVSKLKPEDIPIIRRLYAENKSQQYIANLFGVNQTSIGFILRGVTWRHVP